VTFVVNKEKSRVTPCYAYFEINTSYRRFLWKQMV